jgi:hypothetical protein
MCVYLHVSLDLEIGFGGERRGFGFAFARRRLMMTNDPSPSFLPCKVTEDVGWRRREQQINSSGTTQNITKCTSDPHRVARPNPTSLQPTYLVCWIRAVEAERLECNCNSSSSCTIQLRLFLSALPLQTEKHILML